MSQRTNENYSVQTKKGCVKSLWVKCPPKTWEMFSPELEENGTARQLAGSKSEAYGKYSSASQTGWPPWGDLDPLTPIPHQHPTTESSEELF